MADNTVRILIESILGGELKNSLDVSANQFSASYGIDPLGGSGYSQFPVLLAPRGVSNLGTTSGAPLWITKTPENINSDGDIFIYDSVGSVYTSRRGQDLIDVGDLNDGAGSTGNGAAYYDNYMYFARSSTVARYGPLDGTPSFTDDYWCGTLGLTALSDREESHYPYISPYVAVNLPSHFLHPHSDGRLYIADVVGEKGYLHYIATKKTTVAGDTDDGSEYGKLELPPGHWPTAIESYGSDIVIALYQGTYLKNPPNIGYLSAKLAFWDTQSERIYKIVETPEPIITALKFEPVSGALYLWSTSTTFKTAITKFLGGYTFSDVYRRGGNSFIAPYPGGVDLDLSRILYGGIAKDSDGNGLNRHDAHIKSIGYEGAVEKKSIFSIFSITPAYSYKNYAKASISTSVKSLQISSGRVLHGWYSSGGFGGIDASRSTPGFSSGEVDHNFISEPYVIGRGFSVKRVRIPFLDGIPSGLTMTVKILCDKAYLANPNPDEAYDIATLTSSEMSSDNRVANIKCEEIHGWNSFRLAIVWSGDPSGYRPAVILSPIEIEVEVDTDEES